MIHDQQRDYATTLTQAYEQTSIAAREAGHPAELMLMCQSVHLSPPHFARLLRFKQRSGTIYYSSMQQACR